MEISKKELTLQNMELSECFHQLNAAELELINTRKTQLIYEKGETLFKQGAFAPYVLYVIEGLVKVYVQTGGRRQINVNLAKTGDFLAFSAIFGTGTYNYSAMAIKDSRICMIDKEALKQVLLQNPIFAMQITSRNLRIENQLLEIIKNLSFKQMRGKLASALCYLSLEEFRYDQVFDNLTRQDIADFAGITQESAVKFLKEFERDAMLKLDGKDIQITNREKLQLISRTG